MRYGMMSNFRRSWSIKGKRALLDQQQIFVNGYLYTAINPITGEDFHLINLDSMNTDTELLFLTELKKQHPYTHVYVVFDNAPSHKSKKIHEIKGLSIINLPAYSPELNPAERYFLEVRRSTCNQIYDGLRSIEERITTYINSCTKESIKSLCGYDWIIEQCRMLGYAEVS